MASSNPGPGYAKDPEHKVALSPSNKRVRAMLNGLTIADTTNALVMEESGYDPVYYVPIGDVRMELATETEHHTYCPYKGEASYWSFAAIGVSAENAAWGYKLPYDEVSALKGHLAFYPAKVDKLEVLDAAA
ncbi:DUF427 domain-containing protein [Marinibaculum pumilum]|uniref:DUF427 domain-containing protein n=1 Tax=Marinibaculum pumilum TaxID=1766165 RepID=A0ABV7L0C3_9PROT